MQIQMETMAMAMAMHMGTTLDSRSYFGPCSWRKSHGVSGLS
jgi:hypothetical protein